MIDFLDANTDIRVKHSSGTPVAFLRAAQRFEMDTVAKDSCASSKASETKPDAHLTGFESLPIIHAAIAMAPWAGAAAGMRSRAISRRR